MPANITVLLRTEQENTRDVPSSLSQVCRHLLIISLLFILQWQSDKYIMLLKIYIVLLLRYIHFGCLCGCVCVMCAIITVHGVFLHVLWDTTRCFLDPVCTNLFFLLIVFHAVLCPKLNINQLIEASRQDWFCLLWVMKWKSLLWLVCWHCFEPKSVCRIYIRFSWCGICWSCELFLIVHALYNFICGDFPLSMGNITALIFVAYYLLTCFVAYCS